MDNGFKIFAGIILLLGMAWASYSNNGPASGNTSPERSPSIFPFLDINMGPAPQPSYSYSSYDTPTEQNIGYQLNEAQSQANQIERDINTLKIAKESSRYAQDISFYAGNTHSTEPDSEYLSFSYNPRDKSKLLISGFQVKSTATGRGTTIGNGVLLPFSGQINQASPIFLEPGDRVYLITGHSPVGFSFRTNKCTGYFAQFQKFTPWLPTECPRPDSEPKPTPPNHFSDACLDYIATLPACIVPLQNIPVAYLEPQCRTFITEKINYNTCVLNHKNDPGFRGNLWYIYLNQSLELWKNQRETIKLLDMSGKTIGTVAY
jgi:hypothetical protein